MLGQQALLFVVDWRRAVVFVLLPHLWAAYGITTVNLLQHDGCDEDDPYNHSRNFEGVTRRGLERVVRCLHEVNEACIAAGGRLHLVKNVYATKEQLRRMYAHAVDDLARIKATHDPANVLVNDFFARTFG